MYLTLPSGKEVELFISHSSEPVLKHNEEVWQKNRRKISPGHFESFWERLDRRLTTVTLVLDGDEYTGVAKCHPTLERSFNKEFGRKEAMSKVLEQLYVFSTSKYATGDSPSCVLSKEDRRFLWSKVLPKKVGTYGSKPPCK